MDRYKNYRRLNEKPKKRKRIGFTKLQICRVMKNLDEVPNDMYKPKIEEMELHSENLEECASKPCLMICENNNLKPDESEEVKIVTNTDNIKLDQQGTKTKAQILKKRESNAQERFRLRVPRANTKSQYICRKCHYHQISEPRRNMPLAIVDIDSLSLEDVYNKTIHEFFNSLSIHFNIGVWASTTMEDILKLLKKQSLLEENKCNISFCLDSSSMITAYLPGIGNSQVKAMEIIWNFFPQYHKNNSIMINNLLKRRLFKHNKIAMDIEKDKFIKESEYGLINEYLIDYFKSGQKFSKLNIITWKLSWNQTL